GVIRKVHWAANCPQHAVRVSFVTFVNLNGACACDSGGYETLRARGLGELGYWGENRSQDVGLYVPGRPRPGGAGCLPGGAPPASYCHPLRAPDARTAGLT